MFPMLRKSSMEVESDSDSSNTASVQVDALISKEADFLNDSPRVQIHFNVNLQAQQFS